MYYMQTGLKNLFGEMMVLLFYFRFFLEKAVQASSSFVKDKCKAFLREVQALSNTVNTHAKEQVD